MEALLTQFTGITILNDQSDDTDQPTLVIETLRDDTETLKNYVETDASPAQRARVFTAQWESRVLSNGSFEDTEIPVPKEVLDTVLQREWVAKEYQRLWRNNSGGSAAWNAVLGGNPYSISLQTPNDGGSFCSLSLTTLMYDVAKSNGFCIADKTFDIAALLEGEKELGKHAGSVIPLRVLERQVEETRSQLQSLSQDLSLLEKRVTESGISIDANEESNRLNQFRLENLRLHRRWNFQKALAENLLEYYDFLPLDRAYLYAGYAQRVRVQARYSEELKYDFETIPQRIENQISAIFNLTILRDNQLNMAIAESSRRVAEDSRRDNLLNLEIAKSSARIAEQSRRDSSLMKKIAVLTMIFLPGTAIASFFSMTMFNWQAGQGEQIVTSNLWVYFAVTVPLTAIVLALWLWWWRRSQRRHHDRLDKIEMVLTTKSADADEV